MPTRPLDYLEHLIQSETSSRVLHFSFCSSSWADKFYGFPDPCQDPLVKNIREAGNRNSSKPVVKKEPITPDVIALMCSKSMRCRHLQICLVSGLQLYLLPLIMPFHALTS